MPATAHTAEGDRIVADDSDILAEALRAGNDARAEALASHGLLSLRTRLTVSYSGDGGDVFALFDAAGTRLDGGWENRDLSHLTFQNGQGGATRETGFDRTVEVVLSRTAFTPKIMVVYSTGDYYALRDLQSVREWAPSIGPFIRQVWMILIV